MFVTLRTSFSLLSSMYFFFINRKKRVTDGWLSGESEKKRERERREGKIIYYNFMISDS